MVSGLSESAKRRLAASWAIISGAQPLRVLGEDRNVSTVAPVDQPGRHTTTTFFPPDISPPQPPLERRRSSILGKRAAAQDDEGRGHTPDFRANAVGLGEQARAEDLRRLPPPGRPASYKRTSTRS
jgi:hypothetical protein